MAAPVVEVGGAGLAVTGGAFYTLCGVILIGKSQ
jgi:hypothetical protein